MIVVLLFQPQGGVYVAHTWKWVCPPPIENALKWQPDSKTEYIKQQVPDWDDEVVATARFKAFSGQRSDWEPKFLFWKELILKVAHHLGVFIIQPSQVRDWFRRGGLTPLCIDSVLLEMYNSGEILRKDDLVDPSSRRLSQLFKRVVNLIGMSTSSAPDFFEDSIILKTVLEERATEVVRSLSESHWTSFCVITMPKFQSLCNGPNESSAILSYLSANGKARLMQISKKDFIEGVKVSLVPSAVAPVSTFDCNLLHLTWTSEKLQQQLDVIDQRYEMSRNSALASIKSGNRHVALRHARLMKLTSESREKCTSLLNRVEEVLGVIANAESTKKVSEAIQIGAQAIKECGISIEEVHHCLEELDERITSQKQVEEALGSTLPYTGIEDEDVEDEFNKLEMELGVQSPPKQTSETATDGSAPVQKILESVGTVSETVLNTKMADGTIKAVDNRNSVDSLVNSLSSLKLEAA
ncbi:charged multivesicular body protein [Thalictrum thalictroides]|uniref:Charged multivesicular body protein n=1 Tax=Thalictrum thalictroides TaxID=46969 RepID=A0A7J6XED5_THATH|nr:charged multivesicular body protein [Thalictrum thalictroides]